MDYLETILRPQVQQARNRPQYGVVTATVTGVMADGTYELSYLSMGEDEPSAPARVMMPSAGNNRGMYYFPEVGDEVIVAFESGDTNMPVILGSVYNEQSPPPDQADTSSDNNTRTLVSRSGHEITMDDTPGGEKVVVKTQGGHELTLDDSPPGTLTMESSGGIKIEMNDATGSLKISAPLSIELESTQISINASTLQMQSSAGINLQTTGVTTASLVIIDGKPFGAHMHVPPVVPATGTTGPVSP